MNKIYLILYLLLLETGMLWAQSAIPNVDGVSNQIVCNNGNTTAINFTGLIPNTNYNWINNNTSIGLAANGTGNISSFKAINTGISPVTASINVTPVIIETQTKIFNYTGDMQTWTVPDGVTSIMIETYGASGSNGAPGGNNANEGTGGLGAKASGELAVTPGQVLNIFVGGKGTVGNGGFNGGGNGGNLSAGGGGTDIRYPGILPTNRIIVAGGGGRGGCESGTVTGGNGGNGGNGNGTDGTNAPTSSGFAGGGFGAIGSVGGLKGVGCSGFLGKDGVAGTVSGVGGNGGDGQNCCCFSAPSVPGGGGGGGGYSGSGGGGGSAGTVNCTGNDKGGGAGGSGGTSYILGVNNGVQVAGLNAGDGKVLITYSIALSGSPETFNITVNPTPSVTATPLVQTICSGTAISTISMTNNINGTTYNWTRDNIVSVTGIAASGTGNINGVLTNMTNVPKNVSFTITPTVDGCVGTPVIANVIVPATLVVTKNGQTNISCNGGTNGSVAVNLTGGVAPYTYVWNNGIASTTNEATNLSTGTYEVTVTDANGCELTESFTITEPDVININLQETSFNTCSTCNESDLVATITGGTAPYTYLWNDGVTTKDRNDLLNGTYTLTVTDANGCTASKNIVVSTTVELPYRDFTYTNGNAVSELNNFTTCQSGAFVKANSGSYTNGVWYIGSYELFVNNISLGVFTGEQTIDISNYIPITSVRAVGNHNFWSWTSIDVKTYSDIVDVPPTTPIVSTIYYELNSTTTPLTATLSGVGAALKWYSDELGSDYSANAPTPLTNQLGTTSYYVSQANSIGCESKRAKIDVIVVFPITYTHQIDDLLCFISTGSIDLDVSGGTGSYTYLWSNGATTEDITISQGGNYTCTITDANSGFSITTQVLQVLQPLQLKATITPKNVTCFGEENGEATVTATDGTAPYTYSWNDADNQTTQTATGLVPGTYEVTVTDANGCIITETVIITEPDVLDSVPTQVDVLCHGESTGSATTLISGGLAPYSYVWNNGITSTTNEATNLAAGTYEVTVTDANGCIIRQSFTITEPMALNSTPTQVDVLCHGNATGSATVAISGGVAPYTYVWNNGITSTTNEATNLAAGTYEVTVTDANGCIIRQSFTITEPVALNSTPTQVNVLCHGEATGTATLVISGGVAPYTYVWNNGITSTTNEVTNLVAGTYEVTVTDANGCIITETFTITEPTALQSTPTQVNVLCHGNATGSATVVISGGVAPYTYVWNNGITSTTNEATNLASGIYEVTVTDGNGCIITEAFTITEPPLVLSPFSHNQEFCIGDLKTVNDLVAVGSNLKWYLSQYAQTPVQPAALLTSGMYYGTQTVNGCESKSRVEIKVTVHDTPAPTAIAVQYFCANEVTLIEDLLVMGTDILWYDTPIGGSPLNPLASLSNNTIYYASQRLNGCESLTRAAVSVVIHPVNPITTSAIAVCSNTTIGNITIDNYNAGQLKWYDAVIGGNELSSATMVSNGIYYVSTFTNNACISDRQPLQVVVLTQVAVPTVGVQVFCGSASVKDLPVQTIFGGILKWYSSSTATIPLTANTSLGNGTYYVEQTIGQCSSLRTAVAVRVVSLTEPILNNVVLCHGATVDDIPANQNLSVKYLWFADSTTTVPLKGSDVLATGHYFAAFTQNGCVSNRTSVYITVNPKPAKPTGSIVQTFSDYAVVADLKMNEKSIAWFDNYSDAQNGINILSHNTVLQDGKDYYAVHVGPNACLSDPVSVKVAIVLGTRSFDLTSLEYYPNPVEHELTIKNADVIKVITVYDTLGKQIMQKTFNTSELKIDFSGYSAGTYMVRIETVEGSQFVKIIKK